MKRSIFYLSVFLLVILASCSENSLEDVKNSDIHTMPQHEGFNAAFPTGFIVKEGVGKELFASKKETKNSGKINVPRKVQEKSYWCGPASVQMVNDYFKMYVSQTTIANHCGTTASEGTYVYKIVNWLNEAPMTGHKDLPSWWQWEYKEVNSASDFIKKMQQSVGDYSAPQIWHLKTYPSSVHHLPGYTNNYGHYVVGSGYSMASSGARVMYDDPWYGNGGGSNIWADAETVYKCIDAHHNYIIW